MNRPLLLILALSALLALGYARAMPLGSAPDEGAHLQYVRVVATEHRFPALDLRQRRNVRNDANYEAHQSPLYYVLCVPFFLLGSAVAGETGAGQACRLVSILIGLTGTCLVWLLVREIAPDRPAFRTAAAALAAFLPMRLAVIASVSNDALAETTSSLALLLMLRALPAPWTLRQSLALGAALGCALLAKQSAILLLPPALLTLLLAERAGAGDCLPPPELTPSVGRKKKLAPRSVPAPATPVDTSRWLRNGAAMGAAALALSGWWLARNHLLYGDPLGQRAFNWYFSDTFRWVAFRDQLGFSFGDYLGRKVLPTTFASFWGAFGHLERSDRFMGWYDPRLGRQPVIDALQVLWPVDGYPPRSWVYPLLVAASALSLAGGARWYWLRRARGQGELVGSPGLGVLALHGLFVAAAFLNFNATYFQAQGRYLFPAIGVISIALVGGWMEWARRREPLAAWTIAVAALALAAYALIVVL